MKKYLYACLLFLGLFLLWTFFYQKGYLEGLDNFIRSLFENNGLAYLYFLASFFSFFASFYFLVPFTIFLLVVFKNKKTKFYLLVTLLGSTLLSQICKFLLKRERATPFFGLLPRDYSYPSGHTIASLCFYSFLYFLIDKKIEKESLKRIGKGLCISLMFLVPLSRLLLGVHYLSDVIASIFLSFSFLFGILYFSKEDIFKR